MTKFQKNWTNSIDNINELERIVQLTPTAKLITKINYLYRLAGGK